MPGKPPASGDGAGPGLRRSRADELLYRSLRAIYHFERSLVEEFGLGYQEICLLQYLRRRETARVGEIAAALDLPLFSATRLTQRLEARGYLAKEREEGDRRAVSARLEPKGAKILEAVEAANFAKIGGRTAVLSPRELESFILVAERLESILGVEERVALDR